MTQLVWDNVGDKIYESGVDRGVLYPPNDAGVSWNGLTGVVEDRSNASTTPYYLDGVKYLDSPLSNDYTATLNAFTYPDEFLPFDGFADVGNGLVADGQVPQMFCLSYRTKIGNDTEALEYGYKIHLLYNLSAVPSNKDYETASPTAVPVVMSWLITGVPISTPGFRPTCHFIIDSTKTDPYALSILEDYLYGTDTVSPVLPSLSDIQYYLSAVSGTIDGDTPDMFTEDVLDGGSPSDSSSDTVDGGVLV